MDNLLYSLKQFLPSSVLNVLRPPYHLALAGIGAMRYGHPSREITVIAVTGTKGKSTTVELIAAILRESDEKVASLSTIQFRIDDDARPNLYKMTTPGRFFVQHFLRQAVDAGCRYAVIEMTSEGAKQFRHRFIEFDALVFTNLSPEHIESHGSFDNYKRAKLEIVKQLERSRKRPRFIVANADDEHGRDFLAAQVEDRLPYSLADLELYNLHKDGIALIFKDGPDEIPLRLSLVGLFNVYNTLAAVTLTRALGLSWKQIERALSRLDKVAGRVEHFRSPGGAAKQLTAVVDYAHTPDSLEQFYRAFKGQRKICILGNTGGGRDKWKRPKMAAIAERYCDRIILTNEDPYDEDPRQIVEEMAAGIEDRQKLDIIMDRRAAIRHAFTIANDHDYVLISGKGTDPYIMGPNGSKEPWSDARVVAEELTLLH